MSSSRIGVALEMKSSAPRTYPSPRDGGKGAPMCEFLQNFKKPTGVCERLMSGQAEVRDAGGAGSNAPPAHVTQEGLRGHGSVTHG